MIRKIGRAVNRMAAIGGFRITRTVRAPTLGDIGRDYTDPSPSPGLTVHCRKGVPKWYAGAPTIFRVHNGTSWFEEEVLYSHLTLLKLLKQFEFTSVLDIGSHAGNVTRILRHAGKAVTTCEVSPGYVADFKTNYIVTDFGRKFDAIWCSQVLEHQRNVGLFLNKIFDDLADGGVLALTVPYKLEPALEFGHCNLFSPLLLIYHLVMAGFDCRGIALKCYNGNIGVIVRKRDNGIDRTLPQGTLPVSPATEGTAEIGGRTWSIRELLGDEVFERMGASFPDCVPLNHITEWEGNSINWPTPI